MQNKLEIKTEIEFTEPKMCSSMHHNLSGKNIKNLVTTFKINAPKTAKRTHLVKNLTTQCC